MIDDDIELKVLKIRGSQVHLGIDAPKKSAVHRKEVWLRIHGEPASAPKFDDDWENRTLCSDESCIGVIGPDGRCKECGKAYKG